MLVTILIKILSRTSAREKKNTNQHHLWQATTCKQHTIIYEHTKKEDNFLKFATTNKNSTFDLATSAQQIVRQKKMDLHNLETL